MIGKAEWFTRRKYLGWGIHPKTWQGWVYLIVVILLFVIFQALPFWDFNTRLIITIVYLVILMLDVFHIMITMKKDEREKIHEAIEDRNALWVIIMVLVVGILYDLIKNAMNTAFMPQMNYFLIAALLAGAVMKTVTSIYLQKKN